MLTYSQKQYNRSSLFSVLLITNFLIYPWLSIQILPSIWGVLEGLSTIIILGLIYLSFTPKWGHYLTTFLISFFLIANVSYYRVFHDFMRYDVLTQWRTVPSVTFGFIKTMTWLDWSFGLIVPLLCINQINFKKIIISNKLKLYIFLLCFLSFSFIYLKSPKSSNLRNHYVLLSFFSKNFSLSLSTKTKDLILNQDTKSFIFQEIKGYKYSSNEKYPFIKIPDSSKVTPKLSLKENQKPNIILILMESVRAFEMGCYGAKQSYTPNLDKLSGKSFMFKNFYANGTQTVRGELSTLCSVYPNYSGGPIYRIKPETKLSSLPGILRKRGYNTLWISGFSSNYGNKAGFLTYHGIDKIFDGKKELANVNKIGWGPADEEIFKYALSILKNEKEPFFAEIMTLSNHWPFNWPYTVIPPHHDLDTDTSTYNGFTRGIYYTDWAIGKFMKQVKKMDFFENTLFVFVSDHGIWTFPENKDLKTIQKQEAYFRIPLLFYGPNLIKKGFSERIGSQVDIAPTILDLLGIKEKNSFMGKSLFSSQTHSLPFALMFHVRRWNLRIGNHYIYDGGDEFFYEHFPPPPKDYKPNPTDQHVLLKTTRDFLRISNYNQISFGSDTEQNQYIKYGESLINVTQSHLMNNTVFDETYMPARKNGSILPPILIAKSGGRLGKLFFTNSIEALEINTSKGISFFEVDFKKTSDGHYILLNNWDPIFTKILRSGTLPSIKHIKKANEKLPFKIPSLADLSSWLKSNPNITIICNTPKKQISIYDQFIESNSSNQIIPLVSNMNAYNVLLNKGYTSILFKWEPKVLDLKSLLEFLDKIQPWAIVISKNDLAHIKPKEIQTIKVPVYIDNISRPDNWKKLKSKGIHGIISPNLYPENLVIKDFQD